MLAGKRILVGVLNWGLGHASRSAQLIRQLERLEAELVIASDGIALEFLKGEFPNSQFIQLPELKIHYASVFGLQWSIIGQLPKLLKSLKAEKQALDTYLNDHTIDCIISDNRYGLFHDKIPSVLLSHQLNLQLKYGKRKADSFMKSLLSNFQEIWIPDEEGALLSGDLSQLDDTPVPTFYMGSMSHLSGIEKERVLSNTRAAYLAILSGPEPHRSRFEKRLVQMAEQQKVPLQIIRGTNNSRRANEKKEYVEYLDRLNTKKIMDAAPNHLGIISRSGYSTLMDLCWLQLPALMVPTPGQAEQEYLAKFHLESNHFYSQTERKLDLKSDLERAFKGAYAPPKLELGLNDQKNLIISRFNDLLD